MNELKLSRRLKQVAEYVPNACRLVDVGSDHAYLPCYLTLKEHIAYAIAGEVNEGPYQSAKQQVEKLKLQDVISVRKGNGLEVVKQGEVDVVTIAGMGGSLISSILEDGKTKLAGVKRLVLQPNVSADKVRKWLIINEWNLVQEFILEEDNKVYEVMAAEKGNPNEAYKGKEVDAALLLGPFLMEERNEAFRKKWLGEMENWLRILNQISNATTEELVAKKKGLEKRIAIVKEVIR